MRAPWKTSSIPYCSVYDDRLMSFAHFALLSRMTRAQIDKAHKRFQRYEHFDGTNTHAGRGTSSWIDIKSIPTALCEEGGWSAADATRAVKVLLDGPEYSGPVINQKKYRVRGKRYTRSQAALGDEQEDEQEEDEQEEDEQEEDEQEASVKDHKKHKAKESAGELMGEFRALTERMERTVGVDAVRAYMSTPQYEADCAAAVQQTIASEQEALTHDMNELRNRMIGELESARKQLAVEMRAQVEAELRAELRNSVEAELRAEAKQNEHSIIHIPMAMDMLRAQQQDEQKQKRDVMETVRHMRASALRQTRAFAADGPLAHVLPPLYTQQQQPQNNNDHMDSAE